MTGLRSAVSGFPFSVTLPILAQISSAAEAGPTGVRSRRWGWLQTLFPDGDSRGGWGREGRAEGPGGSCTRSPVLPPACCLSSGPLLALPTPTPLITLLLFRTTQDSLNSSGKRVCAHRCVFKGREAQNGFFFQSSAWNSLI